MAARKNGGQSLYVDRDLEDFGISDRGPTFRSHRDSPPEWIQKMTVELATMYDGKLASVTLETGEAIIANSFSPGALTCYLVSLRCGEPSGASVRTREWVGEDEPTEEDLFYFIAETVRHSSYDEYLGARQRMCIAAAIFGLET